MLSFLNCQNEVALIIHNKENSSRSILCKKNLEGSVFLVLSLSLSLRQ